MSLVREPIYLNYLNWISKINWNARGLEAESLTRQNMGYRPRFKKTIVKTSRLLNLSKLQFHPDPKKLSLSPRTLW